MIKKLLLSFVIFTCGCAFATAAADAPKAAPDTSSAKVIAVTGNLVKIEISGDLAAWMKKGAYVRAVTASGTLTLRGAKITVIEGTTVTVQTAMAKDMKVGETYVLSKGKPSAGC